MALGTPLPQIDEMPNELTVPVAPHALVLETVSCLSKDQYPIEDEAGAFPPPSSSAHCRESVFD